jgi:thiol-disulfide isomerase/thioredoxin
MRAVVVAGLLVVVSACGAVDVTESSEYESLQDDYDALDDDLDETNAELDEAKVDLAVSERQAQELDDELAVTEDQVVVIEGDFADFLEYQFSNAGGLTTAQASCLSAALVDDADARAAYFVLLTSGDPASEEATTAYSSLGDVFADCDLDLPELPDTPDSTSAAELPQALADATRPVEVTGPSLPVLQTADISADPAVGTPAPVLTGVDYEGNSVRIDAAADGPTMVVILAHWCPHCNAEIPNLNALRDQGLIPEEVNVVAISSAVNPDRANFPPDTWLTDMDWTWPVLADGIDLEQQVFVGSDAFGVSGVPFTTLIGSDGNVAARWAGERDTAETLYLLEQLD